MSKPPFKRPSARHGRGSSLAPSSDSSGSHYPDLLLFTQTTECAEQTRPPTASEAGSLLKRNGDGSLPLLNRIVVQYARVQRDRVRCICSSKRLQFLPWQTLLCLARLHRLGPSFDMRTTCNLLAAARIELPPSPIMSLRVSKVAQPSAHFRTFVMAVDCVGRSPVACQRMTECAEANTQSAILAPFPPSLRPQSIPLLVRKDKKMPALSLYNAPDRSGASPAQPQPNSIQPRPKSTTQVNPKRNDLQE
ncbi:hypothetical protein BKA65DRAFT_93243 [Rhexocercosporidium sp. MPI-PUGE-AT-0058]|nr:hypothetical protein BKA65DRAFT_93243 [Rhexocercosporidium sp. MPI-PUGE-AT-0058]